MDLDIPESHTHKAVTDLDLNKGVFEFPIDEGSDLECRRKAGF